MFITLNEALKVHYTPGGYGSSVFNFEPGVQEVSDGLGEFIKENYPEYVVQDAKEVAESIESLNDQIAALTKIKDSMAPEIPSEEPVVPELPEVTPEVEVSESEVPTEPEIPSEEVTPETK